MGDRVKQNLKIDIHKAYKFLRENNNSIPDEVLDFMKEASLEKMDKSNKQYVINVIGGGGPGSGIYGPFNSMQETEQAVIDFGLSHYRRCIHLIKKIRKFPALTNRV